MRLTDTQRQAILNAVHGVDAHAEVWLFGSRVDDTKRGGDIDVAIRSASIDRLQKIRIRRAICDTIGEQKIDIVVSANGTEPFFRLALATGVKLDETPGEVSCLAVEVLKSNLRDFSSSVLWLKRSQTRCAEIGIKKDYTPEEIDSFENLTSRYARTTDLLVNKLLRSLDSVEFQSGGTLIDVVNRAEQRGLIDSVADIREIKDLRNDIAHEYSPTELWELFDLVLRSTPKLLLVAERVAAYCGKYSTPETGY